MYFCIACGTSLNTNFILDTDTYEVRCFSCHDILQFFLKKDSSAEQIKPNFNLLKPKETDPTPTDMGRYVDLS